jgi:hypothetical protein
MFQFTDAYGTPVQVDSSIAAREADDAGYCEVYDNIAASIGGPTRQDLRDLGLLTRSFDVEVSRSVTVSFVIEQSTTVQVDAANPAAARESIEDGDTEVEWPELDYYTVRDSMNRYSDIEVGDDDGIEVGHARAS